MQKIFVKKILSSGIYFDVIAGAHRPAWRCGI
jgi:hypothetical protein